MHQRSRAASLHLPLLSGQGWYEAGPAVHDPSLVPAQLPKPPSPFCTRTPSLPELHGGCEHVNLTFSRCLGPQLDIPCRKIRGGGKSYCLLPLTRERRTFTYRCKPWAQHKQIFEYEKGFWNATPAEPHTVVTPWLTERQRRKARTGRKLRVTSTFASLRSHLATPSWAGKNLLCGVHVTLLAFQMKQPACHLGGVLRLPRRHGSSTQAIPCTLLQTRPQTFPGNA